MLYVATVHHKSPRWIEIQTRQLREHIPVPHQIWGSLEGIDQSYASKFDRVIAQRGDHAGKLNHLAFEIAQEASDEDLIMFLDGDAFPIADPMPLIAMGLARAPLTAVRRRENNNDPQPHPCFCVTTVGTWQGLRGDWSKGFAWVNPAGKQVSDVGANLLRTLNVTGTPWVEVLRSNRRNPHPVFFAVYGEAIYHHGAGFRDGRTRGDFAHMKPYAYPIPGLSRVINGTRFRLWHRKTSRRIDTLSDAIYAQLQSEDPAWLRELV